MTAKIDFLPIWKKNATREERLFELAAIARKNPERFKRFVILYEETMPNGNTRLRHFAENCTTTEAVGLCQIGVHEILKSTEAQ